MAKEALVRAAPDADAKGVIAAAYIPVPNGFGGVKYLPRSHQTIGFAEVGSRLKAFGVSIDNKELREPNRIRNDIEHNYPRVPTHVVRRALARAFPAVVQLFWILREEPSEVLGEAWDEMLKVREVYEQEQRECRATFQSVEWHSPVLDGTQPSCQECQSELLAQEDAENTEQENIEARCRSCGKR